MWLWRRGGKPCEEPHAGTCYSDGSQPEHCLRCHGSPSALQQRSKQAKGYQGYSRGGCPANGAITTASNIPRRTLTI